MLASVTLACDDDGPTTPSALDDCISSVLIPAGWQVTINDSDNYTGNIMTLTADTPDLERSAGPCGNDWDDCIDSIRVRPPQ